MKNFLFSCLSLFILIIVWESAAHQGLVDIQFFPPPHLFLKEAFNLVSGDFFIKHFYPSMGRFIWATFLSVPLACLLGIFTGSTKIADKLINPFLALTYPLPKVAIFPLLLLIFGLGDLSKITLIAVGMFYLVYINVRAGTQRILTSPLMDIVHIYKIKGWNYYYHFLIKGIRRDFLIGLKAALGYGLLLVVVSEFSASRNGIGYFIWQSWDQFRVTDMYAGIFLLCLIGFIFSYALDYLINRTRS